MSDRCRCSFMQISGDDIIPAPGSAWTWGIPLAAAIGLLLIWTMGANQALFLWINDIGLSAPDWASLTVLGDTVVALTLLLPFCGRRPDMIRAIVVAAIVATITVHGLKDLFQVLRPAGVLALDQFNIIGPELKRGSFPSGHTTTIFTLLGVFCLLNRRGLFLIPLIGLAIMIGLSRSGVGAHWPADILAGAINGWLAAVIGVHLAKRWHWGLTLKAQRTFAAMLLLCAVMLLFHWHDTRYPEAFWFEKIVAVFCLIYAFKGLAGLIQGRTQLD